MIGGELDCGEKAKGTRAHVFQLARPAVFRNLAFQTTSIPSGKPSPTASETIRRPCHLFRNTARSRSRISASGSVDRSVGVRRFSVLASAPSPDPRLPDLLAGVRGAGGRGRRGAVRRAGIGKVPEGGMWRRYVGDGSCASRQALESVPDLRSTYDTTHIIVARARVRFPPLRHVFFAAVARQIEFDS